MRSMLCSKNAIWTLARPSTAFLTKVLCPLFSSLSCFFYVSGFNLSLIFKAFVALFHCLFRASYRDFSSSPIHYLTNNRVFPCPSRKSSFPSITSLISFDPSMTNKIFNFQFLLEERERSKTLVYLALFMMCQFVSSKPYKTLLVTFNVCSFIFKTRLMLRVSLTVFAILRQTLAFVSCNDQITISSVNVLSLLDVHYNLIKHRIDKIILWLGMHLSCMNFCYKEENYTYVTCHIEYNYTDLLISHHSIFSIDCYF